MADHLHGGHRQRMRDRIINNGITDLQEHEVLEYLLFSFVPRKDTNALAHRLIKEFGSFKGVLNADPENLCEVPGMTENASLFLSVLPEIFRHYVHSATAKEKKKLSNPSDAKKYVGGFFAGLDEERVYAVALDINECVIGQQEWTSKKRAKVGITPTDIVECANKFKAVSILIAHNHPGGSVQPSNEDISLTEQIELVLKLMDYKLYDHLIFNNCGECYSFVENKILNNSYKEGSK